MPLHRLFVGNIPGGTSEQELKNEFSSYGPVRGIDLKSKPNPLTGSEDTFAFVNVELDERTLRQCLEEFRRERYKGVFLNVSRAKESFLDRLKREREEAEAAKEKSGLLNPYKKEEEVKAWEKKPEALPALPTIAKEVESSSSSEESSEESEDEAKPVRSVPVRARVKNEDDDQLVRKWNQETYIEHGKLKIVPITGEVKEVIDKSKKNRVPEKELAEKARLADEKRKQGLTKLQSAYEQQKMAIQAALADGGPKRNKIVFADDEEEDQENRKKVKLFDDEEDDFKGNFTVRKQLAENSEKGQRLYEMQTQFHGDSRFKLDERFLADDDLAAGRRKRKTLEKEKATLEPAPKPTNTERRKQLEILSKVTGREFQDGSRPSDPKSMQRFDPSSQKEPAKVEKRKKAPPAPTEEEIIAAKKAERPEESFAVSDEKFFTVSKDITQVIGQSSGGFSLLSMFGVSASANDGEDDEEQIEQPLGKPAFSDARFKYESSESEEDEPQEEPAAQEVPQQEEPPVSSKKKDRKPGYYSKQGIWKENFFFLPDDVRLEEGRQFFLEFATAQEAMAQGDGRKEHVKDIRRIFKKRRMRETKNVNQMRARRGLKLMKGKRK